MEDNYSKIGTAMAKIDHWPRLAKIETIPTKLEKVGQRFQVSRACAGRDTAL